MSQEIQLEDNRPSVTMNDYDRAWYIPTARGLILKLRFRKEGESGTLQFGPFKDKHEAKQFLVQLKKTMV